MTTSGVLTNFELPNGRASAIARGSDGALWFPEEDGVITRMTTSGAMTTFPVSAGSITSGSDGAIWFTQVAGVGRMVVTQGCAADTTSMCLHGGRFQVQASWRIAESGHVGFGTGVPLTGDTGYFWFFSGANVEVVAKVVDGCAVNGRHWVFAGGLTNVEVTLTVTDTQTGESRIYVNPAGRAFLPIQDMVALRELPGFTPSAVR